MAKRRSLIWLALTTVVLLLIAGYALSQPGSPPGAPAPGGPPGAQAGPTGGPTAGPAGAPGAGAPGLGGAPGAGAPAGAEPKQGALSQSTPEQQETGLRIALDMVNSGQIEGRLSEAYSPGALSPTYGVRMPPPIAVWILKPPSPPEPGALPPATPPPPEIDPAEAGRMLKAFSRRYSNLPDDWAKRQRDFDLQIAGELQRQMKGLPPYEGAPLPPAAAAGSTGPSGPPAGPPGGPAAGAPAPGGPGAGPPAPGAPPGAPPP